MTPMPHIQTTEYRATQLLTSIKHKLSHAIPRCNCMDLKQKSARDQYKDNLFGTQVIVLGQLKAVPVGTWWYWVSMDSIE